MSDDIAPTPHAWFTIPGIQTGTYTLKDRLFALESVRKHAKDATVLDIGCAEGLLSKWLVDLCGAKTVHGIERYEPYAITARRIMRDYDAWYHVLDLDFFEMWLEHGPGELLPSYDIVMALRVIQKLAKPASFIRALKPLIGGRFVVQIPTDANGVMVDARSAGNPFDVVSEMGSDFRVEYRDVRPMHRDHELTVTFKRVA